LIPGLAAAGKLLVAMYCDEIAMFGLVIFKGSSRLCLAVSGSAWAAA